MIRIESIGENIRIDRKKEVFYSIFFGYQQSQFFYRQKPNSIFNVMYY